MTVDNLLFLNWFPFGVKKISTHAHKIRPWYLLVEHSRPFKWSSPDSLHDWQIFCIEEALQGLKKFIHRITWKTYWKGYVKVVSLFSRWQQTSRLSLKTPISIRKIFAGMLQPRSQGFSLEGGRGGNEVGHASESLLSFRECGVFPANFTQSRIFSLRF